MSGRLKFMLQVVLNTFLHFLHSGQPEWRAGPGAGKHTNTDAGRAVGEASECPGPAI